MNIILNCNKFTPLSSPSKIEEKFRTLNTKAINITPYASISPKSITMAKGITTNKFIDIIS
jgi:hypothetical protein